MKDSEKQSPSPEKTNLFLDHQVSIAPDEEADEWPLVSAFQLFPRGTPLYGHVPFSRTASQFYFEEK